MIQLNTPQPYDRDPDETVDIYELVKDVIEDPEAWLDTPHGMLGAKTPRYMIDNDREQFVRELLRSIKHGMAP